MVSVESSVMVRLLYLIIFTLTTVSARRDAPFYRKDYKYITEHDAFYKLHWDWNGKGFNSAFIACVDEEAELFYPTGNEWKVAKELFELMSIPLNDTDIIIGIHDQFELGEYINIRGQPTDLKIQSPDNTISGPRCVTMNIETGIFNAGSCHGKHDHHPYICKKVEEPSCPTIDKGYTYEEETKKCYKFHHIPLTWSKAMETCFMEGGLLVAVDSPREAKIISSKIIDSDQYYYAGFLKLEENFYSVKGKKLEDNAILPWREDRDEYKDCGTIRRENSYLIFRPSNCDLMLRFICEMDVKA